MQLPPNTCGSIHVEGAHMRHNFPRVTGVMCRGSTATTQYCVCFLYVCVHLHLATPLLALNASSPKSAHVVASPGCSLHIVISAGVGSYAPGCLLVREQAYAKPKILLKLWEPLGVFPKTL